MVVFVPTSTAGSSTKTSCTNNILLIMLACDQLVSKNFLVSASDFKIFRPFGSLNVKRPVKTLSRDWLLPWNLFDFGKKNKKGWAGVIQNPSNLLSNVGWAWTFWKFTNDTNSIYTIRIRKDNDATRLAAFWIMKTIKYTCLELNPTFPSWNIKVICNKNILENLRQIFLTWGIFEKDWVKPLWTSSLTYQQTSLMLNVS